MAVASTRFIALILTALGSPALAATEQDCTAQFDGTRLNLPCVRVPGLESLFSASLDVSATEPALTLQLRDIGVPWQELPASALDGVFLQQGYGQLLDILPASGVYNQYELNRYSCTLVEAALPLEWLDVLYPSVLLKADASAFETLAKYQADASHGYRFQRLPELPASCRDASAPNRDYAHNALALWHSFNDNYPFFLRKHIDWQAVYQQAQMRLAALTSAQALLDLFEDMLVPLDDIHIAVYSPDGEVQSHQTVPDWLVRALDAYRAGQGLPGLETAFAAQSEFARFSRFVESVKTEPGHQAYLDSLESQGFALPWNYVANLSCPLESVCGGDLNDNVAYLQLTAMSGYSGGELEQDIAAIQAYLDSFITDSAAQQALILDVRNNEGGFDSLALAVARYFIAAPQVVYRKKTKYAAGFTPLREIRLEPAAVTFTKPIYLLINGETYSAGEVFTLIMQGLPHVTLIGETTQGNLSDYIERILPNGWYFSVPSEVYSDVLGNEYESVGIPPQHVALFWLPEDVFSGKDAGIDKALELMAN